MLHRDFPANVRARIVSATDKDREILRSTTQTSCRSPNSLLKVARFFLPFAFVLGFIGETQAIEPKLLGITIRKYDFIGGRVLGSVGRHATLNMGIAQGVRPTTELWLFRKVDGQFKRVGQVHVVRVRQQTSTIESLTDTRLKDRDLAVISARDLDLWGNNVYPLSKVVKERIIRNNSRNFYDTFDSRAIAKEVLNDRVLERNALVDTVAARVGQLRPERPVFYAMTRLRLSMLDRTSLVARVSSFDVNLNYVSDPVTGRIVGFPVMMVGENADPDENYDETTQKTKADTSLTEDIRDFGRLDQFQEMRVFLGKRLQAQKSSGTGTDDSESADSDSANSDADGGAA